MKTVWAKANERTMAMTKKIIALMLCVFAAVSMFSCARKHGDGDETTDERKAPENIENETKFNFLVMGHDRAANLTDVIMIVSFDTEDNSIALTQFPRDTYFEIDDYYYHKINGLYNYCISQAKEEDSKEPEHDGMLKVASYFEKNLDIKIHYSAVMDLDGFGKIVDAIGGVYMYIPYSMNYNDPAQGLYINLPEGYRTMDGDEAEQFVRFRSGFLTADIGRGDAQKMFMTAFIESVKKNISLSNIDDIASAVLESVDTNMSLVDIIKFGTKVISIDLSNITMMTLPGEAKMCNDASYYVMNRACVIDVMQKYYNIYKSPVDDTVFDSNKVFCNDSDTAMSGVYYAPAEDCNYIERNAQDISDKDIDIPMY